jgi:chromatin structure-remodeling complex subunit SFH1
LNSTEDQLEEQAEEEAVMIPIQIDIDVDTFKIRDSFVWNIHGRAFLPRCPYSK